MPCASSAACLNHDQCEQDAAGVLAAFNDINDDEDADDNVAPPPIPTAAEPPPANLNQTEGILDGKRK